MEPYGASTPNPFIVQKTWIIAIQSDPQLRAQPIP